MVWLSALALEVNVVLNARGQAKKEFNELAAPWCVLRSERKSRLTLHRVCCRSLFLAALRGRNSLKITLSELQLKTCSAGIAVLAVAATSLSRTSGLLPRTQVQVRVRGIGGLRLEVEELEALTRSMLLSYYTLPKIGEAYDEHEGVSLGVGGVN